MGTAGANNRYRARSRRPFLYATTALVAIPAMYAAAPASADTRSWTGAVDGSWSQAGNWAGGVPAPTDEAVVDTVVDAPVLDGGETVEAARVVVGDTAAATLTVQGNATLDVSGEIVVANQAGSTGTLRIGGGGAAGTVSASGVRFGAGTGTIVFNHNQDIVFGSDITGAGGVTVSAGTTRLTGTNGYTGGTTVTGGVLVGNTRSLTGAVVNDATVVFDQAEDGEFAGAISGSGGLRKLGAGALTLSGNHTYAGITRLMEGGMLLSGSHASFVLMSDGTVLVVTGTLDNSVVGIGSTMVSVLDGGRIDSRVGSHAISVESGSYVLNTGTISARDDTLRAVGMFRGDSALINGGTITADTEAAVLTSGVRQVVVNTGTIEATGASSVAVEMGPDESDSSDWSFLANTGTILSRQGDAVVMDSRAGDETVTGNAGTIETRAGDGSFAFLAGDGNDTLLNKGTIVGDVQMGGGDDRLILEAGWLFRGGVVDGGDGTDVLVLGGEETGENGGTFDLGGVGDAATFRNFSRMEKVDGGDWTVTGTAAGMSLDVQEGTASVQGRIGAVTVSGTGRLKGTGTLASLDMQSGTTVAPGNSIGTLTVAGDVSFAANSTYEVEVDGSGAGDRIAAGGTATVDPGARVAVVTQSGRYAPSTTYAILTAAGGVTGRFGSVSSGSAFLVPVLSYDPGTVYLTLVRNDAALTDVARTPNQIAVATALAAEGGSLVDAVLGQDAEGARAAYDALSGEIHASAKGMLVDDGRLVREAAMRRVRAATAGGTAAGGTAEGAAAWGHAFGAWGHRDGDGNADRHGRAARGVLMGADAPVAEDWRLGLMIGYGRTTFDVDGRASTGSADSYHVGAYGGWRQGAWGLRFGAAHSWHEVDTSRTAAIGGFADTARADYAAGTTQAFGELGRRFDAGAVEAEPFAGLAHARLRTDGFAEAGGAAALAAEADTLDATVSALGVRVGTSLDLGGMEAELRGAAAWHHAVGDVTPRYRAAFAGGTAFTVSGAPIARDAAAVEAGLRLRLGPGAALDLSYDGRFGSGSIDQGATANLALRF